MKILTRTSLLDRFILSFIVIVFVLVVTAILVGCTTTRKQKYKNHCGVEMVG